MIYISVSEILGVAAYEYFYLFDLFTFKG